MPLPSEPKPLVAHAPSASSPEVGEEMKEDRPRRWSREALFESSPWFISFCVHASVLFLLGLITFSPRPGQSPLQLTVSPAGEHPMSSVPERPPLADEPARREGVLSNTEAPDLGPVAIEIETPQAASSSKSPTPARGDDSDKSHEAPRAANAERPPVVLASGGGLEGRHANAKSGLLGRGGGTPQSEAAVERGLRWLAAHQCDDGGWTFDLKQPPCNGLCNNSGDEPSRTAATALALLPFLGAGHTHAEGEYQENVKRGLYFLSTRARVTPHGADLQDASSTSGMYGQAMATIVLCESYAMTRDAALRDIAQQAIRFIVFAQDPRGGGWRYTPGAPGDTTVTGWQLMALKSGQLAKLDVPSPTVGLVQTFLDSVQFEGGARYGYLTATPRAKTHETTTAVGLLCRMYTGWRRDNPALYQGVAFLHKWGLSKTNMYYNYYASQVMHHWEGPEWPTWNGPLREHLVASQATDSHAAGSWYFPDPYGDRGGRLYNTALALLTLEVYYRYLPLYGEAAVHDRF